MANGASRECEGTAPRRQTETAPDQYYPAFRDSQDSGSKHQELNAAVAVFADQDR